MTKRCEFAMFYLTAMLKALFDAEQYVEPRRQIHLLTVWIRFRQEASKPRADVERKRVH